MHAWPRLLQTPSQLHLLVNASKSLCCEAEGRGVMEAHESSPGPPVRWRSALGRCCSSGRTRQLAAFEQSTGAQERTGRPVWPRVGLQARRAVPSRFQSCGFTLCRANSAMNTLPFSQAEKPMQAFLSAPVVALVRVKAQASNPSIERTCQGPLRAPCPAAHVGR